MKYNHKKYQKQYRKTHRKYWVKYYKNNKDNYRKYKKEYRATHKKEIEDYNKKHKEYYKEYSKKYRKTYERKLKKYNISWYKKHQEYLKNYRKMHRKEYREYQKNRLKININFKIAHYISNRIRFALKNNIKSVHTMQLINCTIQQLKQHLERKFKSRMNWSNYGKWHIDHIRPCASFDLSKPEEQKKCFNYTNLQPLWAKENISKGNHYVRRE